MFDAAARPLYTVPIVQEAEWATGTVWGLLRKISPPSQPGFDCRTVQPVPVTIPTEILGPTEHRRIKFENVNFTCLIVTPFGDPSRGPNTLNQGFPTCGTR